MIYNFTSMAKMLRVSGWLECCLVWQVFDLLIITNILFVMKQSVCVDVCRYNVLLTISSSGE